MPLHQSFENSVKIKVNEINESKLATAFVTNKHELQDSLIDAASDLDTMNRDIPSMRQKLEAMREKNDSCKRYIMFLNSLEERVSDMKNNIPGGLIQDLSEVKNDTSKEHNEKLWGAHHTVSSIKAEQLNDDYMDPSEYLPEFTDCRKTLFPDTEDNRYHIEPLNNTEFMKIPKYMIGRQTLTTLNDFISAINKVLKAKYDLLALGKNGARKKGDLDLYLQFKREETAVCSEEERKYFFTANDYQREMGYKLDKMKLNLLTVLRHCKKIRELRSGKNIQYVVSTSR